MEMFSSLSFHARYSRDCFGGAALEFAHPGRIMRSQIQFKKQIQRLELLNIFGDNINVIIIIIRKGIILNYFDI